MTSLPWTLDLFCLHSGLSLVHLLTHLSISQTRLTHDFDFQGGHSLSYRASPDAAAPTQTPSKHCVSGPVGLHTTGLRGFAPQAHQASTPQAHKVSTPRAHHASTAQAHKVSTPQAHQASTPEVYKTSILQACQAFT